MSGWRVQNKLEVPGSSKLSSKFEPGSSSPESSRSTADRRTSRETVCGTASTLLKNTD
jgi:hypothetical protein